MSYSRQALVLLLAVGLIAPSCGNGDQESPLLLGGSIENATLGRTTSTIENATLGRTAGGGPKRHQCVELVDTLCDYLGRCFAQVVADGCGVQRTCEQFDSVLREYCQARTVGQVCILLDDVDYYGDELRDWMACMRVISCNSNLFGSCGSGPLVD